MRYVQSRALPHFPLAQLENMATHRLLARLDSLRACTECPEHSDYSPAAVQEVDGILFKDSDDWRRAYKDVKEVLATREHVPRGSKAKRQSEAREKSKKPSLRRRAR